MKSHVLAVALASVLMLSACDDNRRETVVVAPQPQVVQVAPVQTAPVYIQQQHSTDPMLAAGVGAAAGYMIGRSSNDHYRQRPVIVHKNVTVINKTYARPSYRVSSYRKR